MLHKTLVPILAILQLRAPCFDAVNITNLRLVDMATGLPSTQMGVVQLQVSGDTNTWGTICADGFDNTDALVVCRTLGFKNGIIRETVRRANADFLLDDTSCIGTELSLKDCDAKEWTVCETNRAVSVACTDETPSAHGVAAHCVNGGKNPDPAVELISKVGVDGIGFVKVRNPNNSEEWGLVCNMGWNSYAASVVCRELCYNTSSYEAKPVVPLDFAQYPPTMAMIAKGDVACFGSEDHLDDCMSSTWGNVNCESVQQAGVQCLPARSRTVNKALCLENTSDLRLPDPFPSKYKATPTKDMIFMKWSKIEIDESGGENNEEVLTMFSNLSSETPFSGIEFDEGFGLQVINATTSDAGQYIAIYRGKNRILEVIHNVAVVELVPRLKTDNIEIEVVNREDGSIDFIVSGIESLGQPPVKLIADILDVDGKVNDDGKIIFSIGHGKVEKFARNGPVNITFQLDKKSSPAIQCMTKYEINRWRIKYMFERERSEDDIFSWVDILVVALLVALIGALVVILEIRTVLRPNPSSRVSEGLDAEVTEETDGGSREFWRLSEKLLGKKSSLPNLGETGV